MFRSIHILSTVGALSALLLVPTPAAAVRDAVAIETMLRAYGELVRGTGEIMRGQAEMIRADGEHLLNESKASINFEAARSRAIDNAYKFAQNYYARRKLHDEFMAARRAARPRKTTPYQQTAYRRAEATQLSPVSGLIRWPGLLRAEDFSAARAQLDRLFAERASVETGPASEHSLAVHAAVSEMQATLRTKAATLPTVDYLAAHKLLNSLLYEARFTPEPDRLAKN
jgi:hypothetical protein